VTFVTKRKN
ncbi:HAMP domain protein, partial [Vibrio parahaemolyticus V-223/04]